MAIIRDAKKRDLEQINNILEINGQIADVRKEDIKGFVVVEENRSVVGCGMLKEYKDSVEISKVSVLPNHQGKGYGMEIVLTLVGRVRGRPCWLLSVHSHSFWELFDFHVVPKEEEPERMKRQCRHCDRRSGCDRVVMFKKGI
ncbi:MAG: GNAT family N-acetyltransferase [Thermoplasmata archaeon]|nr:MAG: GNAT family N-acetyltransferase [Thermoplasmata archaeon]